VAGRVIESAGTQYAGRVADVLLAVATSTHPLGVSAIGRRVGLSKAVVHRILRSLVSRGLLANGPAGTYGLGPAAAAIGARALAQLDIRRIAMPVLRQLQAETKETTTLSILVGTQRTYLDQVVSTNEIRMMVELGTLLPLHAGSSGKAILAFAASDVQKRVLGSPLARFTGSTITDASDLLRELDKVCRRGVALSRGERQPAATSVAAPIIGIDRRAIGAISVCGPVARFDAKAAQLIAARVVAAAADISAKVAALWVPLDTTALAGVTGAALAPADVKQTSESTAGSPKGRRVPPPR
jgi:DNA-binding IclR family transcriptional regulator